MSSPHARPAAAARPVALVVEDDHDAAEVAAGMLRLLGFSPRIASDGHSALQATASARPALILLDVCLPQMDGIQLLQVAHRFAEWEGVPIVGVSAVYPTTGAEAQLLRKAGARAFLAKPFHLDQLRECLAEAVPELAIAPTILPRGPANSPPTRAARRARVEDAPEFAKGDVAGLLEWVGGRSTAILERFVGDDLLLRLTEDVPEPGVDCRLRISHREAVRDSMREVQPRVLGTVDRVQAAAGAGRVRLRIRAAVPPDEWDLVRRFVADRTQT